MPRAVAYLIITGLVMMLSGCATLEKLGDRLCGIEIIHATFCDEPEAPEREV